MVSDVRSRRDLPVLICARQPMTLPSGGIIVIPLRHDLIIRLIFFDSYRFQLAVRSFVLTIHSSSSSFIHHYHSFIHRSVCSFIHRSVRSFIHFHSFIHLRFREWQDARAIIHLLHVLTFCVCVYFDVVLLGLIEEN